MTATREVTWTHHSIDGAAEASVELAQDQDVYFSNQDPRFTITVKNNTEYQFENSHIAIVIAIGQGRPEPFVRRQESNIDIPSGGRYEFEFSGEPLMLAGHGIVAIGHEKFRNIDDDERTLQLSATDTKVDRYEPLASFSVWDREHYEVVHEQPQRTQHFTLFASMGIVFFAILQVGEIVGYPFLGLVGGLVLIALYWYSGFMGDFIEALRERRRSTN